MSEIYYRVSDNDTCSTLVEAVSHYEENKKGVLSAVIDGKEYPLVNDNRVAVLSGNAPQQVADAFASVKKIYPGVEDVMSNPKIAKSVYEKLETTLPAKEEGKIIVSRAAVFLCDNQITMRSLEKQACEFFGVKDLNLNVPRPDLKVTYEAVKSYCPEVKAISETILKEYKNIGLESFYHDNPLPESAYFVPDRPIEPGSVPKDGLEDVVRYDKPTYVSEIERNVWGIAKYNHPLSQKEVITYHMIPQDAKVYVRVQTFLYKDGGVRSRSTGQVYQIGPPPDKTKMCRNYEIREQWIQGNERAQQLIEQYKAADITIEEPERSR